jgi:Rieske Fe-S protein
MNTDHRTQEDNGKPTIVGGQLKRRGFLAWLTRGSLAATVALAVGQVVRFFSFQPPGTTSDVIPIGPPGDYPLGALVYVVEARAYVGHDAEGLYALDAVCPHLGCLVKRRKRGEFACPCHGSFFEADGQVRTGPATKPLCYLYLWLDEEEVQLMIDRTQPVEPTTRLMT